MSLSGLNPNDFRISRISSLESNSSCILTKPCFLFKSDSKSCPTFKVKTHSQSLGRSLSMSAARPAPVTSMAATMKIHFHMIDLLIPHLWGKFETCRHDDPH